MVRAASIGWKILLFLALFGGCEPVRTTVVVGVESLTVEPTALDLEAGASATVVATPRTSSGAALTGREVVWRSNDSTVATVAPDGRVTTHKAGSTTLVATAGPAHAEVPVQVREGNPTSISVTPDSVYLTALGDSALLQVRLANQYGKPVTQVPYRLEIGDPAVARVDANGKVTALARGRTTLMVTVGAASATLGVRVTQIPVRLELQPTSVFHAAPGFNAKLTARVLDARSNLIPDAAISWESSNTSVALVDASGLVTSVGRGTSNIIARIGSLSAPATVSVPSYSLLLGVPLDVRAVEVTHFLPTSPLLSPDAPVSVFALACGRCALFNVRLNSTQFSYAAGQLCAENQFGPRPPMVKGHDGTVVPMRTCCPHGAPCSQFRDSSQGGADFLVAVTPEGRPLTRLAEIRAACQDASRPLFTEGAIEYRESLFAELTYPNLQAATFP